MICHSHSDRPALAACVSCGAGLCAACGQKTDKRKFVCSAECANSADAFDNAIALIAGRMQRTTKATAWFCWLLGGIFTLLGVISLFGEDKFFAGYLLASSAVLIFVGTWYGRISKKASSPGAQPTPATGRD